jgi:serine/threonine protein kinase
VTAVEACHKRRIAHRDLKLSNILLTECTPPHVKLTDFGCAKRWSKVADSHMRTFIGTPGYMSPELLSTAIKPARYDGAKADIWALGIMLCQMFFDKVPFLATELRYLPQHEQVGRRRGARGLAPSRARLDQLPAARPAPGAAPGCGADAEVCCVVQSVSRPR